MHFTKSQIEEIARRLSVLTKKDSEFEPATLPPDRTELVPIIEYIPLVQDYENRLLSLADLRSMVLENDDQSSIGCLLTINCTTTGADVYIKGEKRTTYMAHYGEMVDVVISAENYDAWYGVITMTQSKVFNVVLNDKSSSPGPGPTPTTTFTVRVTGVEDIYGTDIEGASIVFTDSTGSHIVAIGETRTYQSGEQVRIDVTKEGYKSYSSIVTSNFSDVIRLQENKPEEPYLRFSDNTLTFGANGETSNSISIESSVSWTIIESTLPNPEDYDPEDADTSYSTEDININVGDTHQL